MGNMLVVIEEVNRKNLKWIRNHYQENWKVFCLNKDDEALLDFVDDCETVDLSPYISALTETSFELLASELGKIDPIARRLSSILKLDVSTALHRYLLNNYYIKKARIAKIKSLYDLGECHVMYVDRNYIIHDGFLDAVFLGSRSKYRPLVGLCYRALKSLKNALKFSNKKTDVLFPLETTGFRNLSSLLNLMRTSGVHFTVVDKTYRNVLYGPAQNAAYVCDRFYMHCFGAMRDYARCLNSHIVQGLFLSNFMYSALISKYTSQDLYDQFQFKVILFQNEYDVFQSIAYHQLKKNGVTVLGFMHGEKVYTVQGGALVEYDNFLVWGEYYKNLFEKLMYRGKKITVVGNPAYDRIAGYKVTNAELLQIRNSYKKIISVYTQSSYGVPVERQTQIVSDVCNYVRDKPDVCVFVKHHPYEFRYPTPDYDAIICDLQNVKRCHKEYELYDLIAISDLILTPHSTVGLEAILFRKNVMYLNYGAVKHFLPYALEGSAIELNDSTEFGYYVDGLLSGSIELDQQNTINLHANGLDGQATQHSYDVVARHLRM